MKCDYGIKRINSRFSLDSKYDHSSSSNSGRLRKRKLAIYPANRTKFAQCTSINLDHLRVEVCRSQTVTQRLSFSF